jgi:phosphodiesterase/alkaline phosphatase D-like protein
MNIQTGKNWKNLMNVYKDLKAKYLNLLFLLGDPIYIVVIVIYKTILFSFSN